MPPTPCGGPGVSLLTPSPKSGPLGGSEHPCVLHPGLRLSVERLDRPVLGTSQGSSPRVTTRVPCGTGGSDMLGWAPTGDGSLSVGEAGGQGADERGQGGRRNTRECLDGPVSKATVCGALSWDSWLAGPSQGGAGCYPPQGQTVTRFVLFLENEANGTKAHSPKVPVLPSTLAC